MRVYEELFIVKPDAPTEDVDAYIGQVKEIITGAGGSIEKEEKWGNRKLAYRGQFDGSRPKNDVPVNGADLRAATDAVLSGGAVSSAQRPSMGCNIKWSPGNAPAYFG